MSLYLHRIAIQNFRTFGKFDLVLPGAPGLLIVTGPNGVGKSSFFDAIEWTVTSHAGRFEEYRKKETEAVYLTRDGCLPFSHSASLEFSSGDAIVRRGSPKLPTGTPEKEVRSILANPKWNQDIKDLRTYLSLTHFLGQASQQRFIARDGSEQWSALRNPSGVERIEFIRRRLRGRPATLALNRKAEAAEKVAEQHADRLAHWDALVGRLRRLEQNAELAGALPREQIGRELKALLERYSREVPDWDGEMSSDLARDLSSLRQSIIDTQKGLNADEATLIKSATVPRQYDDLGARKAAVTESLAGLRAAKRESESTIGACRERASLAETQQAQVMAQRQRLSARLATLGGAQADLRECDQARERNKNLESALLLEQERRRVLSEGKSRLEGELDQLRRAREEVTAAVEKHRAADALARDSDRLGELEGVLAGAKERLRQLAAAVAMRPQVDWEAREEAALKELRERTDELRLLQERAGAMSSALSAIAQHLSHDDTECPICRSIFHAGQLKRLADDAVGLSDAALPASQALHEQATSAYQTVLREREAYDQLTTEWQAAKRAVESAQKDVDWLRRELISRLNIADTDVDIRTVIFERAAASAAALDSARRDLATLESGKPDLQLRVTEARESYQASVSHVEELVNRLKRATEEFDSALRRYSVRVGEEGWRAEDIPTLLAQAQAAVESHEGHVQSSSVAYTAANSALSEAKASDARNAEGIKQQEAIEAQLQKQIEALLRVWTDAGFLPPPSVSAFEQRMSELKARRSLLEQFEAERQRLATALESSANREELASVTKLVSEQIGQLSVEAYRHDLERAVADARSQFTRTKATHEALVQLADRLQDQADKYSNDFLRPLNDLIIAFNDALLIAPGSSVYFNAEYFADRTDFTTRLQQRKKSGAPPEVRVINPHFVLSEGQMAANGLSMLCSASVSYPWSRWPALLLDDPLQHNDVIHAAAFADLMRNLVGLKGYQILMSSHDRGETEFLERKFTAASLPCTVLHLTADSPEGVVSEVRLNTAAREAMGIGGEKQVGTV